MVGGNEVLATILDPFHRAAQAHSGDADEHILRIELATDTKTAPHMRFMQMDA